ncbi:MAG: alpha/beta hydrolase [Chitinophagaceae bacterium]|nr:alpha/beta hydrolase [Chitinophagaceae bacterium]
MTALSYSSLKSQSISGNWEGILNIQGTEIPIVFHIKDSSGKLSATFDSPKQMAYNLPCNSVFLNGDSLVLQMKNLGGKYEGLLTGDKKNLGGKWFQGGGSLLLDLKKTSDVVTSHELKRPQTPKAPFNYYSEEVIYFNPDKSIQFGASFTRPAKWTAKLDEIKYPVALLITGSGQQDRDATLFEHKSFAVIADYLTKQGIAVLRVDDRGKGKTTGNISASTSADFAIDVEAGIEYLKNRNDVDISNIGLIGHSEGGLIAPMVASKRKDIKFIVLLAGPAVPIIDLMEQQAIDVAATAGVSKEQLELYRPLYRNIVNAIINQNNPSIALENATAIFNRWQTKTPAATVKNTTNVTDEKSKAAFIGTFANQLSIPWYRYFMKVNPADYLSKLNCAVLALNGEKDIQVAADLNLAVIQKIMAAQKVHSFKVQKMPGLNHLFQHCETCSVEEYGELEETFAPEALQLIGNWIKEVVAK